MSDSDGEVDVPEGWDDLLGSGALLKRTEEEGEGPYPDRGQEVRVAVTGRLMTGGLADPSPTSAPFEEGERRYRLGEGEVPLALDLGLRLMRPGERALLRCEPRFAFGSDSVPDPERTRVEFDVRLLEARPFVPVEQMDGAARAEEAAKKKELGNRAFKQGDWSAAMAHYGKALEFAKGYFEGDGEEDGAPPACARDPEAVQARVLAVAVDCGNNLAQAQVRAGRPGEALETVKAVLGLDADNVKALYRAGKLSLAREDFAEAAAALGKARALDPENRSVRQELRRLAEAKRKYKEKERRMYSRMLSGPGPGSGSGSGSGSVGSAGSAGSAGSGSAVSAAGWGRWVGVAAAVAAAGAAAWFAVGEHGP